MPDTAPQFLGLPLFAWVILLPLVGAFVNLVLGRWLSRQTVHVIAVGVVVAAFVVALLAIFFPSGDWSLLYKFKHRTDEASPEVVAHLFSWIQVGTPNDSWFLNIGMDFRLDTLSSVMVLIITGVGSLIHLYSTGYMSDEKRYSAYFGYLNLFTGSMLILVLAANMPVMFIGWEGVGLCSFLLIGFWFENPDYATAGRKAFVVNRIGDFAFLLGMFLLWYVLNHGQSLAPGLDFADLRSDAAQHVYTMKDGFFGTDRWATIIGILLFIGACGKSAQIPLYVWLPDAMAGPTPVSALIHAATMVTAGVYMVCRLGFLFAASTTAMMVVATIGTATALIAAFYAFAQTDMKKVLAYSTVSQLGFMFAAAGTGNWVAAIFHLGTHAFFKAGLFLGAGSVMHGMAGSGDITKMGGLKKHMPITRATFLIYCLAIAGFPLLSGFFSKDEILGGLWALGHWGHHPEGWPDWYGNFLWITLLIAALGTAVYMWRLYFLVFEGEERSETAEHAHESPWTMWVPLAVLALLAAFAGVIGLPHLTGTKLPWFTHALSSWLAPSIDEATELALHNSDNATYELMGVASLVGIAGIGIAWWLYGRGPSKKVETWTAEGHLLHEPYIASKNKLWVDELYDLVIVRPFRAVARGLFEIVDRFIIDTVFVGGWAFLVGILSRISRWVQNGQVQRYIVGIVIGAAAIFFFASRGHHAGIAYREIPQGVELKADPGAGLSGVGVKYRWDVDNDGQWDKKPDAAADDTSDAAYIDTPTRLVRRGDIGSEVTLWIIPKSGGKGETVTEAIVFAPSEGSK
ncbi:MAG TPA: NADH-quinone oxidoreductase subunit L [Kofleriaceae bacterium]|nr:NADH-quinone oxidoreductase subunit L [Kofleriaceae bacterium]